MPRVATFDFQDAPPAQGGGGDDYIPAGDYLAKTTKIEDGTTKDGGKRMMVARIQIVSGDYKGSNLTDRFAFGGPGDSKFPLQRWHAFLLALGAQIKGTTVKIDLDQLENRPLKITVRDEKSLYQGEERVQSRIVAYYSMSATTVAAQSSAPAAPAAEAAPPAPPPAPPAQPPAAPPEQPAAVPVAPVTPVAEAPVAAVQDAPAAVVEEVDITSVDDLFS